MPKGRVAANLVSKRKVKMWYKHLGRICQKLETISKKGMRKTKADKVQSLKKRTKFEFSITEFLWDVKVHMLCEDLLHSTKMYIKRKCFFFLLLP